jgi:CMP/dCMP kinase
MTLRSKPIVAIDGPAGAGKSTVTRLLAERLGYTRVDTGALYRSVAWVCRQDGVDFDDEERVSSVARELAMPSALALSDVDGETRIRLRGLELGPELRTQELGILASQVSQMPGVREGLLEMQRSLGKAGGVVLEGRDIGTVVFPDAEVKFFLTASVEVRAERRRDELQQRGTTSSLSDVIDEVRERDRRDSERPIAPLRQAPDAVVVDSSKMSIDEVIARMAEIVHKAEQKLAHHVSESRQS